LAEREESMRLCKPLLHNEFLGSPDLLYQRNTAEFRIAGVAHQ